MVLTFEYQSNLISFDRTEGIMVNATEMAKPFNKKVADFLRTNQAQDYITSLGEMRKIDSSDLVRVVYGNDGGTWLHEDVALLFAQWLAPRFAIWCNDRIKELMQHGHTSLDNISRKELAKMIIEVEEEKEKLVRTLTIQAPKVEYYEKALSSDYTMPISVIAKDLGLSAVTLNKKLAAANIQYKQGNVWLLYQKYANLGYARVIETPYNTPEGTGLRPSLKWTEKGKEFIMAAQAKGLI